MNSRNNKKPQGIGDFTTSPLRVSSDANASKRLDSNNEITPVGISVKRFKINDCNKNSTDKSSSTKAKSINANASRGLQLPRPLASTRANDDVDDASTSPESAKREKIKPSSSYSIPPKTSPLKNASPQKEPGSLLKLSGYQLRSQDNKPENMNSQKKRIVNIEHEDGKAEKGNRVFESFFDPPSTGTDSSFEYIKESSSNDLNQDNEIKHPCPANLASLDEGEQKYSCDDKSIQLRSTQLYLSKNDFLVNLEQEHQSALDETQNKINAVVSCVYDSILRNLAEAKYFHRTEQIRNGQLKLELREITDALKQVQLEVSQVLQGLSSVQD